MSEPKLMTDPETGREYYEYPSGFTRWKADGRIRSGHPFSPITADPKGMLQKRNEKSRQIAREAIDEGVGLDLSLWGTGEGWRRLIVHTVQTYMKSGSLRGMAETFMKLAQAGGYLTPEAEKGQVHIDTINVTLTQAVANILAGKGLPATDENVLEASLALVERIEDANRNRHYENPGPAGRVESG